MLYHRSSHWSESRITTANNTMKTASKTGVLDTREYNALDLAQPTDFKSMLATGQLLWGTACRIPHEEVARLVATLPHHFCFIDGVSTRPQRDFGWRLTLTQPSWRSTAL